MIQLLVRRFDEWVRRRNTRKLRRWLSSQLIQRGSDDPDERQIRARLGNEWERKNSESRRFAR